MNVLSAFKNYKKLNELNKYFYKQRYYINKKYLSIFIYMFYTLFSVQFIIYNKQI